MALKNSPSSEYLQQVALNDLRFFAYHGFYPEEQMLGNEFMVDVILSFPVLSNEINEELSQTVNYEIIYEVVSREMQTPRKLLEGLCNDIMSELRNRFDFITQADVKIRKSNPPFGGGAQANSTVRLIWNK